MPDTIICVGHKRVKEYAKIQKNCKYWVKNTKENATKKLKEIFGSNEL